MHPGRFTQLRHLRKRRLQFLSNALVTGKIGINPAFVLFLSHIAFKGSRRGARIYATLYPLVKFDASKGMAHSGSFT